MSRLAARLLAVAVVFLVCGCSKYEYRLPETGATLEGTITYGSEKVPMALINVFGEKGQAVGQVGEDGKYKVENVPLGDVKIGVNTEAMKGQMISQQMASNYKGPGKGGTRAPPPRFISLPARYFEPETSGIKTTIRKGPNTFDIVVTPAGK